MTPLEILKEAVKSKSWPMVRLALKEFEETPTPTKTTQTTLGEHINLGGGRRPNLFHDDGTTTKVKQVEITKDGIQIVGEHEIDSHIDDKKFNSGKAAPRLRPSHKPKELTCVKCGRSKEVDIVTYTYHKKPQEKGDEVLEFVCGEC